MVQNLKHPCADGWWVGCAPASCCVAGCHGELGTTLFAGNNCIVAGARQGDGEQLSAEPGAPGLICWQTEGRDHVSPRIPKIVHLHESRH